MKTYRISATNFFKHKPMMDGRIFYRELSLSEIEVMPACDFKYIVPLLEKLSID